MLISVKFLSRKLGIIPKGVLHVGAHTAEESAYYEQFNWGVNQPIIWVEAQEILANELKSRLDPLRNKVICAVAWDGNDEFLPFHITSNQESSSLFELDRHKQKHPRITYRETIFLKSSRLEELIPPDFSIDFVNLDIQGAELRAIKGLGEKINNVKWIYTEVNKIPLYRGIPLIKELDAYLESIGFERYLTRWVPFKGWGDSLYIANSEKESRRYPLPWRILIYRVQLGLEDIKIKFMRRLNNS